MNSKVLECMNQTVAEWANNPEDCRNVERFTKDQIRAAIREFAEMAQVSSMANSLDADWDDANRSNCHIYNRDILRSALAIFGVEDK
jgi:hypothetical protein